MNDTQLFAFENDFVLSLRCIPMAVRLKLDRSGIKLTLRQWSRFTRADRAELLATPCARDSEVEAYRARLVELVSLRASEEAIPLPEPPHALHDLVAGALPVVADYARAIGVAPPTAGEWRKLSELQRFVLVKLTRDKHENVNFIPAMREFGMAAR